MKYLEDSRLTQLTSDLTGAFLNTRGSGNGGGGTSFGDGPSSRNGRKSSGKGDGKGKGKDKQQQSSNGNGSGGSPHRKNKQATSPAPAYLAYNPAGYSTYNNGGGGTPSSHSSCRVIYGRVEAYTTKRAGSDKKTAFEVGERYAHEMERLNKAVEALKRRHALEQELDKEEKDTSSELRDDFKGENGQDGGKEVTKKVERRGRSRSLDGVTFSTTASPKIVYDRSANTVVMMGDANAPLSSLEEGVAKEYMQGDEEMAASHAKRNLPLEGILKQPSSSKRCRATSFDISTGPSSPLKYHHSESSSSLLAGQTWTSATVKDSIFPLSVVHPSGTPSMIEEDLDTHPLIPQPSLYQSSLSEPSLNEHAGNGDKTPTIVPRRLVTDLILTLNASFPDYDFGDAQVSDFCTLSMSETMRRINDKLGEFAATTDEGRDFLPKFWSSLDDLLFGLKDCEVYSYAPKGSTGEDDPMEFLTMSMAGTNEQSAGNIANGVIGGQGDVMFSPTGGGRIVSEDVLSGLDSSMALDLPNQISPASYSDPPHVTLWSTNYFFVSRNKKRIVLFACVQTMRTPSGNEDDDYFEDMNGKEYNENNLVFDEARRGIQMLGQKEEEGYSSTYQSKDLSKSLSDSKAEFMSASVGGDGESVMVEDTDVEDQGVDVDGDADQCENEDFDTGALGISVEVPPQVV